MVLQMGSYLCKELSLTDKHLCFSYITEDPEKQSKKEACYFVVIYFLLLSLGTF